MALSKSAVSVIVSTAVPAGTLKTSPVAGAAVNCSAFYGGDLLYSITNSATAPTAAASLTFQASPDGTTWFDFYTIGGDLVASSVNTGTIPIDVGVMYVRAIAYGNTGQSVTVFAQLMAVQGY